MKDGQLLSKKCHCWLSLKVKHGGRETAGAGIFKTIVRGTKRAKEGNSLRCRLIVMPGNILNHIYILVETNHINELLLAVLDRNQHLR